MIYAWGMLVFAIGFLTAFSFKGNDNARARTRAFNKGYHQGYQWAHKALQPLLEEANADLCEKFEAQFKYQMIDPFPKDCVEITEGIDFAPSGMRPTVFRAQTLYVTLKLCPNEDGYATWEDIGRKEKE